MPTAYTLKRPKKTAPSRKDAAASYDRFKKFGGKQYTGMAVGRAIKWYYDKGEWKDRKIRPDKWEITYAVKKRRAGRAPEGSGAPVGTAYHWFILAHQVVRKLNANDYSTSMTGVKYKLAHKRAGSDAWDASGPAEKKRLIAILREQLAESER